MYILDKNSSKLGNVYLDEYAAVVGSYRCMYEISDLRVERKVYNSLILFSTIFQSFQTQKHTNVYTDIPLSSSLFMHLFTYQSLGYSRSKNP